MESALAELESRFGRVFGSEAVGGNSHARVHVVRAPGRVNLIGEHTDYNEGLVFPMAIEPEVRVVCRARADATIRISSTVFPQEMVEFSLDHKVERAAPSWGNYSRGVAAELVAAGIPLCGMDALISNTLPVGGGLSSSAAIEVGTALALLTVSGSELDRGRLALLCQKAEHEFAGVPVGIMDQTAVAQGKAGHAMLLDCRDLSRRFIPIDSRDLRIVIANTMVKHELSGGEYAKRRAQCEQGVAYFHARQPKVRALRDVTPQQLQQAKEDIGEVVFRRCRHVVSEIARTADAAEKLTHQDYEQFGELMAQSHQSLRDDYEVSCPELDFLVEQTRGIRGVYGARMTGGGFGGCIVALAQPRAVEPLTDHLTKAYQERFKIKPTIFATVATAGASVMV